MTPNSLVIFNQRGELLPLSEIQTQLDALGDDATKQRFIALREAYLVANAAKDATAAAKQNVVDCVADLRALEDSIRALFPPMTATDAARAFIQSERLTRVGRI